MVLFVAIMALCGAVASFLMTWMFLTVVGLAVMPAYALVMIWQGTSPLIALAATFGGFAALQVAYALTGSIVEFRRDSARASGADSDRAAGSPASSLRREEGPRNPAAPRDARTLIEKPSEPSWPRLGGWLPLVAVRHVACQQDGSPWDGRRDPGYRTRIFVLAWFGRGSSIAFGRPVRVLSPHRPLGTGVDSTITSLDAEIRHRRESHHEGRSPTDRPS